MLYLSMMNLYWILLMVENGQLNDDTLKALDGVRTDLILLGRDRKDKE